MPNFISHPGEYRFKNRESMNHAPVIPAPKMLKQDNTGNKAILKLHRVTPPLKNAKCFIYTKMPTILAQTKVCLY